MTRLDRRTALVALAATVLAPAAPAADWPGDSLYRIAPRLVDQDGRAFGLADLAGGPVLVSMFYSGCEMVCPLIFETVALARNVLPAGRRERVRVLMVSFDSERDTVAQLKRTAEAHHCDAGWTLARAAAPDVRLVAAALGIQYRRLPSGAFNHSSDIVLLDGLGRITARSARLGEVEPALATALARLA